MLNPLEWFNELPLGGTSNLAYIVFVCGMLAAGVMGVILVAHALKGASGIRARILILQKRQEVYFLLKELKVPVTKEVFKWKKKSFNLELNYTTYLNSNRPVLFYDYDKAQPLIANLDGAKLSLSSSNLHMLTGMEIIKQAFIAARGLSFQLIPMLVGAVAGICVGILVGMYMPMPGAVPPPTNATTPVTTPSLPTLPEAP